VNLDPFAAREARLRLPLDALGIDPDEPYQAHDLLADARRLWRGPEQRIRLDPADEPAAFFRLERFPSRSYGTPCYWRATGAEARQPPGTPRARCRRWGRRRGAGAPAAAPGWPPRPPRPVGD
jgi:hypothetical protein